MTDYEKLKALLTEFGVGFKEVEHGSGARSIECHCEDSKITGYSCFYTSFEFNNEGKFIEMGAWE